MFCKKCGIELSNDDEFCYQCGTKQNTNQTLQEITTNQPELDFPSITHNKPLLAQHKYESAIKVFLIIACVFSIFMYLIPLIWSIPMTVWYFKESKNKKYLSTGFKICTFLFVSSIAGILMLADN